MKSFARRKSATFRIYQKSVGISFKYNIAAIDIQLSMITNLKITLTGIENRMAFFSLFWACFTTNTWP